MSESWIKLHTDVLHDPKILRLHPISRYGWVGLLLLSRTGRPPGTWKATSAKDAAADLTLALGLADPMDDDAGPLVNGDFQRMQDCGMIDVNDAGLVTVLRWDARQGNLNPSDSPERVRARVRKHRGLPNVTTCNDLKRPVTTEEKRVDQSREKLLPPKAPQPRGAALADGFKAFYQTYPLHKEPDRAERAFRAALKRGATLVQMLAAIRRQVAEREALESAGKFVPNWKHPATWLNAGCWNDEPVVTGQEESESVRRFREDNRREIERLQREMQKPEAN